MHEYDLILTLTGGLAAALVLWVMRYPFKVAVTVSIALAQIGEFSFILATIGRELRILTTAATNALVATSILSIVINSFAYRAIRPADRWTAARPWLSGLLNRAPAIPADVEADRPERTASPRHRSVVIGFGPTGRAVVRLLRENGVTPTVVELNMDTVRMLRQDGIDALYGDATRPETLEASGVATAGSLILASAGMANSTEVIRSAHALNSHVRVRARSPYLHDVGPLTDAGAHAVHTGEGEVALALIEDILETLGATAEQIDRERARAHRELVGEA
jgi:CPA2 family monovalent cation:H+ antiporter-2